MFKKYYKEANDDIKPSNEFLNSVIEKARKQQASPPVNKYYKYAVSFAAAAVIISVSVISMPYLTNIRNEDGIIIEENAMETAVPQTDNVLPQNDSIQLPASDISGNIPAVSAPPQNTSKHSYTDYAGSKSQSADVFASEAIPDTILPQNASKDNSENVQETDSGKTDTENTAEDKQVDESGILPENRLFMQAVEGNSVENSSSKKESGAENDNHIISASGAMTDIEKAETVDIGTFYDSDVPVPQGYRCTRAAWNGYTFTSEDGAVINVEISYGGDDSEPYYNTDGDNIFASFGAHNMTVLINSTGADISVIEEIINSLR